MITVRSTHPEAVRSRVRRLPQQVGPSIINAAIKRDAYEFLATFKKGIRDDVLGLTPLESTTRSQKASKGYSRPSSPLYGKGANEKDSFINSLEIVKKGNTGWKIQVREGSHWSGLSFKAIVQIHTFGTTITRKSKSGRSVTIRIPPRPAINRAMQKYLRRRRKGETSKQVKAALTKYINTGKLSLRNIEREAFAAGQKIYGPLNK